MSGQPLAWLGLGTGLSAMVIAVVPAPPDVGTVPTGQGPPAVVVAADEVDPRIAPTESAAEITPHPPQQLRLPGLAVSAPIAPVGVESGGALEVPADPRVVGWWRDGATPGATRGTVLLAGHVDSAVAGPGALFRISELRPADEVLLETAVGGLGYVVLAVRRYPKAELPAEVFEQTGNPRLVLISCGGRFDRRLRRYADNVVVYAVPAPARP